MSNIVLDDNTNHDSSSVSASTSNNEESLDSCSNDRKYKASIKTFLKDLIAKNDPDNEEDTSDLELDVWEAEEDGEDTQDHDSVDSSSLFKVDTHPTLKDNLDVPAYNHKFNEILQQTKDDIGKTSKNEGSSRSSCFNCLGNHSLRDCPLPHDPSAITKNRRQFSARFTRTQSKTSRYHLDDEQKFASFVPGQISNKLRKALGLAKHQLPNHIYKMRTLGYPPGWMEDAKISHSGLTLYDCKGKEVPDLETEEGEIIPEGSRDKYDIKKIISYPGFNVPCSPSTKDDFEFHECPPMTYEQSKERMLSQLSQNSVRAYKRPRIISNTACAPTKLEDQDITRADMEVDETPESAVNLLPVDDNCRFIPPLPKDTPPRPPPPPPPPSTESDSEGGESRSQGIGSPVSTGQSGMSSPRAQSPSLSDLETRKQLLLAELEDGGSSSDTTPRVAPQSTPGPSTSTLGKVKSVDLGTPILQSASPYSHLPSSEKFSHHICSVINFENLPDSTGNYERMSDLIRKVRTAVTRIQQEGDDCNDGGK